MQIMQIHIMDTTCAARAWAAAAALAGAYAPTLIADALIARGDRDLLAAVLTGTAAAEARHDLDRASGWGGPQPRGVDVHVRGGKAVRASWSSDTHDVEIAPAGESGWLLSIRADDLAISARVRAALVAAYSWREPRDYEAIVTAAGRVGLSEDAISAAS